MRLDGPAKVRGEKVYARDLRPRDMPGWGTAHRHALIVRAGRADAVLQAVDPAQFPAAFRPWKLVTAGDLAAAEFEPGDARKFFAPYWLTPPGHAPEHAGQPIAIALFEDPDAMRDAATWLRDGASPAIFGGPPPAPRRTTSAAWSIRCSRWSSASSSRGLQQHELPYVIR